MSQDSLDRSKSSGMSQLTKDRFEAASKSIAIVGGIVSAVVLIVTLQGSLTQRKSEHRWNQARLAMQLVDEMMADAQAFDALRMIDWNNRTYQVTAGREETITTRNVSEALDVRNNHSLSPGGVYVRESFDRLFHHMGKMERAVLSGLIVPEDIRSPLATYYTPMLRTKYDDVIHKYMDQLGFHDAAALVRRLSPTPASAGGA